MKKILLLFFLSFPLFAESPFHTELVITSPFLSMTGYGGMRRANVHKGTDCYSVTYYPVITSIMDGEAIEIGINDIYGKYVIVKHADSYFSLYAHGKLIYNSASGKITTDTPLMIIGSTGYSDDPHLHIEVWQVSEDKITYYDPEDFF